MYIRFIENYIAKLSSFMVNKISLHLVSDLNYRVYLTHWRLEYWSVFVLKFQNKHLWNCTNFLFISKYLSSKIKGIWSITGWLQWTKLKKVCKYDVNFPGVPNCNTCVKISAISLAVILLNRTLSAIQIYFRKIFLYTG